MGVAANRPRVSFEVVNTACCYGGGRTALDRARKERPGAPVVKNKEIPGSGRCPGMATRARIRAWEIPWAEESGRLQSMGSQSQTRLSTYILSGWIMWHVSYISVKQVFYFYFF